MKWLKPTHIGDFRYLQHGFIIFGSGSLKIPKSILEKHWQAYILPGDLSTNNQFYWIGTSLQIRQIFLQICQCVSNSRYLLYSTSADLQEI